MLQALQDRSDVIRKAAETWFVEHGEPALDFLVQELASIEEDAGLNASIADGKERDRGKSVAAALWLTLVRGLPRERCYEVMNILVHHPSPQVRAIILFTAASLRTERFLEFFDILSHDEDPFVREKYRGSLVHLLVLAWFSTPELDEPAVSHALSLLEPELAAILDGDTPARFVPGVTLGELLGRDVLPFHRDRFISLLENVLPELSEMAAARAGKAIEQQCWIIKDRDKYINMLWAREKQELLRDEDCLNDAFHRLVTRLEEADAEELRRNYRAALSSFPYELYDEKLAALFFDSELVEHSSSSRAAIHFYASALVNNDKRFGEDALGLFQRNLTQPDEEKALTAAIAGLEGLKLTDAQKSDPLQQLLRTQTDRFFEMRESADLKTLCFLTELFLQLEDERYFQLFERAWSHRYSEDSQDEAHLASLVRLLAYHKKESPSEGGISPTRNKRIIPYLLDYALEDPVINRTGLKAICIYSLLKPLGEFSREFLTDQVFERILARIQDPEEHPRARAAFAELLDNPHLTKEQHETLREVYLGLARAPHDWNLRAKACWNLGKAGERRAIPVIYELMMAEEAPMWRISNGLFGLYGIEAKSGDDTELGKIKAGARRAVEFLETVLALYKTPEPEVKITHLGHHNSPYELAVVYRVYPPLLVLQSLRDYTGQDFGYDIAAWKKWLTN